MMTVFNCFKIRSPRKVFTACDKSRDNGRQQNSNSEGWFCRFRYDNSYLSKLKPKKVAFRLPVKTSHYRNVARIVRTLGTLIKSLT